MDNSNQRDDGEGLVDVDGGGTVVAVAVVAPSTRHTTNIVRTATTTE